MQLRWRINTRTSGDPKILKLHCMCPLKYQWWLVNSTLTGEAIINTRPVTDEGLLGLQAIYEAATINHINMPSAQVRLKWGWAIQWNPYGPYSVYLLLNVFQLR